MTAPASELWPIAEAPQDIARIFGWGKQHDTMGKTKHRSAARVGAGFLLKLIADNLIRIPKLITA